VTPLLTIEKAAQILGVARCTVYALINGGKLEAIKVGRILRVDPSAIERFKKANRVEPKTKDDAPSAPPRFVDHVVREWGPGADRYL
jgi:excisionase family DNA binding protein